MKFFISSDHVGYKLKSFVREYVKNKGFPIKDLGPFDDNKVDYPDFALKLCKEVLKDKANFGILICGSGIGMSISANRHKGIFAALCYDSYTATMSRKHNNANVLCLGQRVTGKGVLVSILDAWLNSSFEGGRHQERLDKIFDI